MLAVWLIGRLLVGVAVLVSLAVCRPRATAASLGMLAVGWLLVEQPVAVLLAVLLLACGCGWWSVADPGSWRRRAVLPALGWWRSLTVYRRLWRRAMHAAELTREDVDGVLRVPRLARVRCGERVDVVQVRGLLGQRFPEWEEAAPMLAHTFGASDYRLHRGDDRRLTLELVRAPRGRAWNRDRRLELEETAP